MSARRINARTELKENGKETIVELAKQFLDVGVFTNRIDEMRAFYGERIGLPV